jgi:YVTN family beta-propeller protein
VALVCVGLCALGLSTVDAGAAQIVSRGAAGHPHAEALSYTTAAIGGGFNGASEVAYDPDTEAVYVTNRLSNSVSVIDANPADSGAYHRVTTTIPGLNAPLGLTYDRDTKAVYVANSGGGTVSMIDADPAHTSTYNTIIATVTGLNGSSVVAYDPDTKAVYVANSGGGTVSMIDADPTHTGAYNTVTATVNGLDNPAGMAYDPDTEAVYVANEGSLRGLTDPTPLYGTTVSVIDANPAHTSTYNKITTTVAGLDGPQGVAYDPDTKTVYVANELRCLAEATVCTVSVIDANPAHTSTYDTITATVTGITTPTEVAYDRDAQRVYVTDQNGNAVAMIDANPADTSTHNKVTATVTGVPQPLGLAYDPDTKSVYVAERFNAEVPVIDANPADTSTYNKITAGIVGLDNPYGVAYDPDAKTVYVTSFAGNEVFVFDANPADTGTYNKITATLGGFDGPSGLAYDPDTKNVYVTNESGGTTVSVVDADPTHTGTYNTITATVTGLSFPFGVTYDPDTKNVYVANANGHNVLVIDANPADTSTYNTIVGTIPAGYIPCWVTYDRDTKRVYVANNGDNTVSVVDANPADVGTYNTVTTSFTSGTGLFGVFQMAYDPDTKNVYVVNSDDNTVSLIDANPVDTSTYNTITTTIRVGKQPAGVAYDPDTKSVEVVNLADGTVSVIDANPADTSTYNTITTTIPVGTQPLGVAYDPDTKNSYVTNQFDNTLSVITPVIQSRPTTTTLAAAGATFGTATQNVSLIATVSTATEGMVAFTMTDSKSNTVCTATSAPLTAGGAADASCVLPSAQAAGTYTITANYTDPAGNFGPSSGTNTLTIAPATPMLLFAATPTGASLSGSYQPSASSASTAPIAYATPAQSPTNACTLQSDGKTVMFTAAGTCTVTANQAAAGNYGPASATQQFTVGVVTPSVKVTSNPNPSAFLQQVTLTAAINPAACAGTVLFTTGNPARPVRLGSAPVNNGTASVTTRALFLGNNPVTAVFTPTAAAACTTASGTTTQQVNLINITLGTGGSGLTITLPLGITIGPVALATHAGWTCAPTGDGKNQTCTRDLGHQIHTGERMPDIDLPVTVQTAHGPAAGHAKLAGPAATGKRAKAVLKVTAN